MMSQEAPRGERISHAAELIDSVITAETIYSILKMLQEPAPSTTVLHTRTPILKLLVSEAGVNSDEFDPRFLGTRSPAVLLRGRQSYWFSAHADTISYVAPEPTNERSFPVLPNCAHRPLVTREFPAAVLRWSTALRGYERISAGVIGSDNQMKPYYTASSKPRDGFVPSDRIVFTPTLTLDSATGLVAGNMDNAAGLAVCVASLRALSEVARARNISLDDFRVGFVFPDEEEGLADDPAYFGRGARRIGHRAAAGGILPDTIVNVDGHDTSYPQPVVRYAAYVSGNKGTVVPPDVYADFEFFLQGLAPYGVVPRMTEAGARVSRSDDAGFMEVHDQIMPVGYDVSDPHFNDKPPTANLDGLVQTAKAITWIAAEMTK